jgi:putative chitinase
MILRDELAALCHEPDKWIGPLNDAMGLYEIDTARREAHFLAQIAHESGAFKHLSENLNYSPAGLLATFPTHFTPAEAVAYAHDAERIANRAYADRLGNGDEASGDGWLFRGRGLLQITGRGMYRRVSGGIGVNVEAAPALLLDPVHAALSAAWFWSRAGCNELADADDFEGITRKINGGLNGLTDRREWLAKAQEALA